MEGNPRPARIVCKDLPEELLDKNLLKEHFNQFGKIVKVRFRPKHKAWMIEYEAIEEAESAILKGGKYMGHIFDVRWDHRKRKIKKDDDAEWLPDPEVLEELEAMGFLGDRVFQRSHNLRPEGMIVDAYSSAKEVSPVIANWKMKSKAKSDSRLSKTPTKKNTTDKVWTAKEVSLMHILKQPALTLDDRFKVLDARDKLTRLKTKTLLHISTADHLVGTCPDMCPEKERLMRVIQHQVAVYEQDTTDKGMNPRLAVKQYSRSSADQEVPLPHELRPVKVLQFTMKYLMHHIMNLCDLPDVNLAEWYHFLWDRTRSIRKDITQQALCCQDSVLLLEQCARFHIHCSARLVAEDVSVFDHRINTENLTKCLQTLKYMYHDLHIKNESCPNEAEFRAYIILLNLNDGNFMWEVQQLKQAVQKSAEVRFALDVYSALSKNNYVKFFKLVHSTTYLNACILLRYFIQVRTKALSTLIRCYSPRASYSQFSLTELETLLAFEDTELVIEFVLSFGLLLNETGTHVILDKKTFSVPILQNSLDRAILVVESKRQNTVGEVVCGSSSVTPFVFENYTPSNSFNENGVFIMTENLKILFEEEQQKYYESESMAIKQPVVDTVSKSSDYTKPFWSIKTDTVTSSVNTFISKTESASPLNIFGTVPPKESAPKNMFDAPKGNEFSNIFSTTTTFNPGGGFAFKLGDSDKTQQTAPIFGGPIFTNTKSSSLQSDGIFGSVKKDTDIIPEATKQFSFAGIPLSQQRNIFAPETPLDIRKTEQESNLIRENEENRYKLLEKQKQLELERQKLFELETRRRLELEKQKQIELAKRKLLDIEKQKQIELEKLKQIEIQRQKQIEFERQKQIQIERQKKHELEKQRLQEIETQKQLEEETKKRIEIEKQKRIQDELMLKKQQKEERQKYQQMLLLKEKERKLNEEIESSVKQLMNDLLTKVEKNYKDERLKDISKSFITHKTRLFVKKWRNNITIRKKKRQAIDQNPIWIPARTAKEEAGQLFSNAQTLALTNIKRYTLGQPSEIPLPDTRHTRKISVPSLYKILATSYSKLGYRAQTDLFWKLTVSLPDLCESHTGISYIEDILTDFFNWKDRYGTTTVTDEYQTDQCFHYCIEKKQGIHSVDGNSNGLLFIINEITDASLKRILSSFTVLSSMARIPVACILINNHCPATNDLRKLRTTFEADEHITNYTILYCTYTYTSIVETVQNSLEFLVKWVEKPPPLELNLLNQFLQTYLVTELWKKVTSYSAWNTKYKRCLKLPNVVINLHNEAIEKLKEIFMDDSCLEYQDFCEDFEMTNQMPDVLPCNYRYFPPFWKLQSYRLLLLNKMNNLKLPKIEDNWPPQTLTDLEDYLLSYLSEVFEDPSTIFYKVLAIILRDVDPLNNFCDIKKAAWVDVIQLLALEKLQELDFSLRHTEFHTKSVFQELVVVYDVSKLGAYNCDEWFYLNNSTVQAEIENQLLSKSTKRKHQQSPNLFEIDLDLDELERSLREDTFEKDLKKEKIMSAVEELGTLMADLEESMKIHGSVCVHLQTSLTNVLSVKKNK